ncbi:MAG: hypothetical protein KDC38_11095, partial [Planctomycetes bacterium]|nr:hypothetical protein [Planctomycetota bacterium]
MHRVPSSKLPRLRRIEPGSTYLITKKTNDDRFVLRPSEELCQVLLYVLVDKACRHGILLHGFCFMSNHFHLVLTDPKGRLPAFMGEFLTDTSKAIQVLLGDDRRVWSPRRYDSVKLLDLDATERKIAYTILNPLQAGLTEPRDWPGLTSARWRFGETIVATRPEGYFSRRYRPARVSIELIAPASASGEVEIEESCRRIAAIVDGAVEEAKCERKRAGEKLSGARRVRDTSRETRCPASKGTFNPRFASLDPALRAAAVADDRQFRQEHEEAKRRYIAGKPRAVFPPGTYGYRQ